MVRKFLIGVAICMVLLAKTSAASETEDMAAGVKCMPAKKIIKLIRKFDDMKPEKKDTVSVTPTMQLKADVGRTLPERVYMRSGTIEHIFNIDKDGMVTDFSRLGSMDKNGELCIQDQQLIGKEDSESGIQMAMDFGINFKNTSGTHTIAELVDGAKDGKSHYKKMMSGPLAILVPKMTHMGVMYLDENNEFAPKPALIYAAKNGKIIEGLEVEKFGDMFVVGLEDLQNLGADGLKIDGGNYRLTPIPSIEKMKKFGIGSHDAEPDNTGDAAKTGQPTGTAKN
jgi:hypothetical protein